MRTISITQSPSISVIQGAYEWLRAEERHGNEVHLGGGDASSVATFQFIYSPPPKTIFPTQPPVEDWLKFQRLVREWRKERKTTVSLTSEMAMLPSYQQIIAMGEKVLPLIVSQLRSEGDEPDHWFWALRVLTGVDPIQPEDQGNISKMAQAWLNWAESEGYAR
jgi:hypothetical protein